ncbi:hypothetical protein [Conexibacter arvalis]|uniref:Uncharacterized protein n=1 Tax=Conexibacter arvalis TaxID=912552 RepID=A0A840IA74_9ACTN|nr:hypothetical protein [Conexibacter arvalis]MBB4661143.1 hypothetical protein [Conexibacter arvalis]
MSIITLAVIWPRRQLAEAPKLVQHVSRLTRTDTADTALLQREFTANMATRQLAMAQCIAYLSIAFRIGASALIVQLAGTVAARIVGA